MASVSSLLKSAQSTQQKIQDANDAEVAYEWSQSAQTYDDYTAYQQYLNNQLSSTTDPTKALSYTTKLSDAFSSYANNEIQRQTQAITEGNATIDDKMSTVEGLYNQAVGLGDENLAQNLVSTWDSLSVQKQNEAQAALTASTAATTAAATALKNQVSDYKDQLTGITQAVTKAFTQATTPQEQAANIAAINAQLPSNLQIPEGSSIYDVAASVAQNMSAIYQQAIAAAPDDATARTLQGEANDYQTGTVLSLPSTNGSSINLNLDDLQKQIAASNVGQNIYTAVNTANGQAFVQNKLDNYQFGHDANGNVVAVPTYSMQGMNPNSTVTDTAGNPINIKGTDGKSSQATYEGLLKNAGFAVTDSDGSLLVQDTTGQNRLNGTDSAQVYMGPDGRLQFNDNENNQYDLSFDKNGTFNGVNKQIANPFLEQYSTSYRGNDTPYFENHQDQAQEAIGTAGLLTPETIAQFNNSVGINKNPILSGGDIAASTLPSFSTTGVLQNAASVQANNNARQLALQAPQIATAPVPQIQAPNIAQSILSSRPNASITVAKPTAPTATISTQPVNNNPTVSVQTKAPSFNIKI